LLFIFLRFERPKESSSRTLSRDFISAGETVAMPAARADGGSAAGNDARPSPSRVTSG